MFCQNCGKEPEEIGKFCPFCGKETGFAVEEETATTQEPIGQTNDGTVQQVVVSSPINKLTKKQKCSLLVAGIIVILGIIGYQIGAKFSDPEAIANKYFEALSKADYSTAYNYLMMPQSDLLTSENYVNYMNKKYGNTPWIVTYKIDNVNNVDKGDIGDLEDLLGSKASQNSLTKNINVSYISKENNEENRMNLNLVKSGKKKLLIFDNWKIDPDNMLQSSWRITVPKGAELFVNGKKINKSTIEKKDSTALYNDDTETVSKPETDVFELKNIFPGQYNVKVTMQDAKEEVKDYDSSRSVSITLSPSEELQAKIKGIIHEYNQKWIAATNAKDFNMVKDYIIENSYKWKNLQSYFSGLSSYSSSYQYSLKSTEFGDMYLQDATHVMIRDTETWDSGSYSYTTNKTFYLEKVNDKWLIYDGI